MKLSTFDFNRVKALHHLLEEAHVARAAARLGITPAAASNALRRLREDLRDPLLVKKGRGMVRTRVGEELRIAACDVIGAADRLLDVARPFDPATYGGQFTIAMADHVAALLMVDLDRIVRDLAPQATLVIAGVPVDVAGWLRATAGILISPLGAFAALDPAQALHHEPFYEDHYVCLMRRGHPASRRRWNLAAYVAERHVLVAPRGVSNRSDVDQRLEAAGLQRRIERVVPNFMLAMELIRHTDAITAMPSRCAHAVLASEFVLRDMPIELPSLNLVLGMHPAHASDARTRFLKDALYEALRAIDARRPSTTPLARAIPGRGVAGRAASKVATARQSKPAESQGRA